MRPIKNFYSGKTVFKETEEEDLAFFELQLKTGGTVGKIADLDKVTTEKAAKRLARKSKEKASFENRLSVWREEKKRQFKTVAIDLIEQMDFSEDF